MPTLSATPTGGINLMPWKRVVEQRLREQIAATARGCWVSWDFGKARAYLSYKLTCCLRYIHCSDSTRVKTVKT